MITNGDSPIHHPYHDFSWETQWRSRRPRSSSWLTRFSASRRRRYGHHQHQHYHQQIIIIPNTSVTKKPTKVMRANSWLYHYYMVQSRLQYGLAYGAHSPAALSSLYYPHVASQYYEPSPASLHPAYLQAAQLPYPHYAYSPPVQYYHSLPPNPTHTPHLSDTKDPLQVPLDFSKSPPGWESNGSKGKQEATQHWDYLRPQDLSSKSPSWKSDSSGSPLERLEGGGGYPGAFQPRDGGQHYTPTWSHETLVEQGKLKKEVQEVYTSDRNNNPHCL